MWNKYPGAALVTLMACTVSSPAFAVKTYYIEEVDNYFNSPCGSTSVNEVTASLGALLSAGGWSGSRWTNDACVAQDWREACSPVYGLGGVDFLWADSGLLTVFAGHGQRGGGNFLFRKSFNGVCSNILGVNSRLGAMSGAQAAYSVYLTSCTLKTSSLVEHANQQWVRQNLGFDNSPSIPDNNALLWFIRTGSTSNVVAWLQTMEEDYSGDLDNSPIVVSYGTTAAEADAVRNQSKIHAHTPSSYMTPRSSGPACGLAQPAFYYNWIRINHGSGPC